METVAFTSMEDGTKEDYDLLARYEEQFTAELPDRLLAALDQLKASYPGYKVSRYEHSLQGATRALRDGRDEEYVVATLLHDIGDEIAPFTHPETVAAILKPFVRPELCWKPASTPAPTTFLLITLCWRSRLKHGWKLRTST